MAESCAQDGSSCHALARLLRDVLCPFLLQQGGDHLSSLLQHAKTNWKAPTNSPEPDPYRVIENVFCQMQDSAKVVWAPGYGAATLQRDTPHPSPRSEINVLGLDGWEQHQHRYALLEEYTSTATCQNHQVQPGIPAGKPDQISLQQLPQKIESVLRRIDTYKRHYTVGFYTKLVRIAVKIMLDEEQQDASGTTYEDDTIDLSGDVGGFRDVHSHSLVQPLSTCWPLVEQVFHYLAEQEHGLHAGACIAAFHTAVALHCSNMTQQIIDDTSLSQHVDRCMEILSTAARAIAELASLRGSCSQFADCLKKHLVAARALLDEHMLACHHKQVSDAMLPALDFASEKIKLQEFEVQLGTQDTAGPQNSPSLRDKSIRALAGVPVPPMLGDSSSAWCDWVHSLEESSSKSWSSTMLCLQQIEQHFYDCTERYLRIAPLPKASTDSTIRSRCLSAAEVEKSSELLKLYSQTVAKVECWDGVQKSPNAADDYRDSPMLLVQLRSLEALLVWIVLCLIYQRVETEEWPGIYKYRLPVEADDLRHLVRGGNSAAQRAVTVVAEYVCRVADRSSGRVCFSLESDDTLDCVVDYAKSKRVLMNLRAQEVDLAAQRTKKHYEKVKAQQRKCTQLARQKKQLNYELPGLETQETKALHAFEAALQRLRIRKNHFEREYEQAKSRSSHTASSSSDTEEDTAFSAMQKAQEEYTAMFEEQNSTSDAESHKGIALQSAKTSVANKKDEIDSVERRFKQAKTPPSPVYQPLPDSRETDYDLAVLFYIRSDLIEKSMPLLQQFCCVAQLAVCPWPLQQGALWDVCKAVQANEAGCGKDPKKKYETWNTHFRNKTKSCNYVAEIDISSDVHVFADFQEPSPTSPEIGPRNVNVYTEEDGVWYPRAPRHTSLRWRGGPLARYSQSSHPLNPFRRDKLLMCAPSDKASAASLSFTEQGKYIDFMHLPSGPGNSRLGPGYPTLQDCTPEVEQARGNIPLARLDAKPQDRVMSEEQWIAFSGLRAFPCLQIRNLSVGLAQETLVLDRPEVVAAIRMAMYHIGQLDRRVGEGKVVTSVALYWLDSVRDVPALCEVLLSYLPKLRASPGVLLQAPILCEMAAFVASCCTEGEEVSQAYCDLAGQWATELENELTSSPQATSSSSQEISAEQWQLEQKELKAKITICHYLAIIACGCSASPGTVVLRNLEPYVGQLCKHMLLGYTHSVVDITGKLKERMTAVKLQAEHVMAGIITAVCNSVAASPQHITDAFRNVYTEAPADLHWSTCPNLSGCWVAEDRDVYTVNLLTGTALCNGKAPSHLPVLIVNHKVYQKVFPNMVFHVFRPERIGDHDVYRTVHAINGCIYSWSLDSDRLLVTETCNDEALELLPLNHEWCKELPPKVREGHAAWLSWSRRTIVLRPVHFAEKSVRFMLIAPSSNQDAWTQGGLHRSSMQCYAIPDSQQGEPWQDLLSRLPQFQHLWHLANSGHSNTQSHALPIYDLLSRIEHPQFIHVLTSPLGQDSLLHLSNTTSVTCSEQPPCEAEIRYYLPRFNLHFELKPGSTKLYSYEHSEYYVAGDESLQQALSCVGPEIQRLGPLPLPLLFHQFIVLVADKATLPVKVLIPDALESPESRGLASFARTTCTRADLEHHMHVYDFHPYTGNLDTSEVQSRLHFATLHAASSCALPLAGLGMTGGEHALQLLRQCWLNRPLIASESDKLKALTAAAVHTPALQLMCARTHAATVSLPFLYPPMEAHDQWLAANFPQKEPVLYAYSQEMHRPGRFPVVCNRRILTEEESHDLMTVHVRSRKRNGQHLASLPAEVEWSRLQKLSSWQQCKVFWRHRFKMQSKMHRIATENLTQQSSGRDKAALIKRFISDQRFISDLNSLRSSAHQTQVAQHCADSLKAYRESAAAPQLPLKKLNDVNEALKQVQQEVQMGLDCLANFLLEALAFCPECDEYGTSLKVFQAAALATKPAVADLVRVTIQDGFLNEINPLLSEDACSNLFRLCQLWQVHCVLLDKVTRCLQHLHTATSITQADSKRDILTEVAVELSNERQWDYSQHPQWLAFELLRRIMIRPRQYTVAKQLLDNLGGASLCEEDRGAVLQLNMGEGKTRVILPMVALELCGRGDVVRLNFLSELLPEAVHYLHAYLTGTLLTVKLVQVPFSRDVHLSRKVQDGADRIAEMAVHLRLCQHSKAVVCIARESRLSLELKAEELDSQREYHLHGKLTDLLEKSSVDILDESDELLKHSFQLVYAWGVQCPLTSFRQRVIMIQRVLHVLCKDEEVRALLSGGSGTQQKHCADESIETEAMSLTSHPKRFGSLPSIRFIPGKLLESLLPQLKGAIVRALHKGAETLRDLQWLRGHNVNDLAEVLVSCEEDFYGATGDSMFSTLSKERQDQLLMLRGLLGHNVLEHCLEKRYGVDYGTTKRQKTRLAVPFRACDVPSERSEFKHPDVAIFLTHLSYYKSGLPVEDMLNALRALLPSHQSSPSVQQAIYRQVVKACKGDTSVNDAHEMGRINSIDKLDLSSSVQVQILHKFLRYNFVLINFWLERIILPMETQQFPQNLRRTPWQLASSLSGMVAGFSGTNDILYPLTVKAMASKDKHIQATDGRMMCMLARPDKCTVTPLPDSQHSMWSRLLDLAMQENAHALIDAGAQLAGRPQHDIAAHFINRLNEQRTSGSQQFRGVVFYASKTANLPKCIKEEGWCVMDMQKNITSKSRSPIREADAFVLFDEARCRGSDMKLKPHAKALLTLGPGMCRDKLMQAAMRMRQLEQSQTVTLVASSEVCRSIRESQGPTQTSCITPRDVLMWSLSNTAGANAQGLAEYIIQGKHYAATQGRGHFADDEGTDLRGMYAPAQQPQSVKNLLNKPLRNNEEVAVCERGQQVLNLLHSYASRFAEKVQTAGAAAEECEREVEQEQEVEQEMQQEVHRDLAVAGCERDWDSWEEAMQSNAVDDFVSRVGTTPVQDLGTALEVLLDPSQKHAVSKLCWRSVTATQNFSHYAAGDIDTASQGRLRQIDYLAMLPDSSVVALSNREAEYLLRADRSLRQQGKSTTMKVAVTSVAFVRWLHPATKIPSSSSPSRKFSALLPWHAFGGSLILYPFQCDHVAHNIVATQLFNGETDFEQQGSRFSVETEAIAERDKGRKSVLTSFLFDKTRSAKGQLTASDVMAGAKQLVQARQRGVYWEGSMLEGVCKEEVDRY